jgi:hypothetical protein
MQGGFGKGPELRLIWAASSLVVSASVTASLTVARRNA